MEFTVYSPTKVIFAPGAVNQLATLIPNGKKIFIITDKNMVSLGLVSRLTKNLSSWACTIFDEVEPNPTDATVDSAATMAKKWGADVVIGFGGGSPMDVAKGVSCLATNGGVLADYRRGTGKMFESPGLPVICIPTTAGTGSEVTFAGVFSFPAYGFKAGIITPYFYPSVALVDPELTYSVPRRITAATGLDALTHAMESYLGNKHTPQSDGMALVAVKTILDSLGQSIETGDHTARENMAMASLVASHASSQAEIGLGHAAGYPVTDLYHLEHGFACAMFLPCELALATVYNRERMLLLSRYCGFDAIGSFSAAVTTLLHLCQCPMCPSDVGYRPGDEEKIITDTMNARYIQNTPGGMTIKKCREIIDKIK